ncbi:ABC transporter substrate-binding protein [Tsukamurella sp. 8F]|uniref:ABC transporter substrate-binding protein n=1 Tax=unclassified Tsukamurella TaxID=2633480 RepID=UPI0023B8A30C|nr:MULTISPECIES: ABC transporter substrate-binding protein [unclassified Tsukamurella]MDF0530967.1 ABC transporter substrate-binding protein [Tsukamurella sp. 8J]MDF0588292.1 ABC transporter substrate-binding protein [Tsukamurella sp. 8F]
MRHIRLAALLLSMLLALVACGSGGETAPSSSAAADGVTVSHQYGETRIPAHPARVVTLSHQWSDSLVRLGVPITAEFVQQGYSGKDDKGFEWTPQHTSEIVPVNSDKGVPDSEQVLKYRPDVILAGYLPNREAYDALSAIAPTIPVMTPGSTLDSWQDVLETAGKIFGKESLAADAKRDVDAQIAAVHAKYPAAEGKTFAFGQLTAQRTFGIVTSETDPAAKLLAQFGLKVSPAVKRLSDNGSRVIVSPERIDVLRADLLVFWAIVGDPGTLRDIPGWTALPAVTAGTTVFLANDTASAFSEPTVYSVPWATKKLEPALARLRA